MKLDEKEMVDRKERLSLHDVLHTLDEEGEAREVGVEVQISWQSFYG